jgi:peptidoglycan/LPS O-acetylase OafA/YrhL
MSEAPSTPAAGTRKRLDHIDAMRPIKQAAVISTHAIIFLTPAAIGISQANLLLFTHFSREAFLFVSACMLTYSYRELHRFSWKPYARRRFISVGLPYLTWTLIYFLYSSLVARPNFPYYRLNTTALFSRGGLDRLAHLTWTGYYHLYYLLVILEFYLLFPLLLKLVHRYRRWHVQIMVGALLWQLGYAILWNRLYSVLEHVPGFDPASRGFWETRLVTSYALYLIAGIIVALHLDDVHQWIVHHRVAIVVTTALGGAGAVALNLSHLRGLAGEFLVPGYDPFNIVTIPYNVGAILCVYLLGVYLVNPSRSLRTKAAVKSGSDNSYGIYLSQMIWIPLLVRATNHFNVPLPWPLITLFAVIVVYLTGFAFSAIASRTPLARAVTGRGQVSWSSLPPRRRRIMTPLDVDTADGPLDLDERST